MQPFHEIIHSIFQNVNGPITSAITNVAISHKQKFKNQSGLNIVLKHTLFVASVTAQI